jgi:mRNA interferase MazF
MEALKRGDIRIASGAADYAGRPRPFVIVHDDRLGITGSATVCGFTTDPADAPFFRIPVAPSALNGLKEHSRLMVDKITTVPRSKVGRRIGRLADEDIAKLNRALAIFLGLGEWRR